MFYKTSKIFSTIDLMEVALSTRFIVRSPRKITPFNFLVSFCLACSKQSFSLRCWAEQLSGMVGDLVSHQAIHKKLSIRHIPFLKQVLELIIKRQLGLDGSMPAYLNMFSRVMIQDSTCVKLSKALYNYYSGSNNGLVKNAIARIQLTYNLKSYSIEHLDMTTYSINDAAYAAELLTDLEPGDLLIRDLGYWNLKVFRQIQEAGAYFLSRLILSVDVFDLQGNKIDLVQQLKKLDRQGVSNYDLIVLVGAKEKVNMRLIGYKLTEEQAKIKRKTAKKNRHHKIKISKESDYLMSWNLFVTNVEQSVWGIEEAYKAYKMRWQIETMFKNFKSNFHIEKILHSPVGQEPLRPEILMYLSLIYIAAIYQPYFYYFFKKIKHTYNKILSPFKFARFIQDNLDEILKIKGSLHHGLDRYLECLEHYYCYEKRKSRLNMFEYENLTLSLS